MSPIAWNIKANTRAMSTTKSDQKANHTTLFHTPPPVDESRSWLAEKSEQESYGLNGDASNSDQEHTLENIAEDKETPEIDSKQGKNEDAETPEKNKPHEEVATATSHNIEDIALTPKLAAEVDGFVNGLSEPKYTSPLTADEISKLYQAFYDHFHDKVETYVQGSFASHSRQGKEVQMESLREIQDKKKVRSLLPTRVRALMEAAEVRATEAVYSKIFSVAFGDDRSHNEFIQKRIDALSRVPVTLGHFDQQLKDSGISSRLEDVGEELIRMNEACSPRAKLGHLLKAHKCIVSVLTEMRSGQTSADAILPVLLFCIVHFQAPNVWLNAMFIQRFRNKHYLHGEDIYCLTNLEASVAFLDTVTLESLGIDIAHIPSNVDITPLVTSRDGDPLRSRGSTPRSSRSNSLQQPEKSTPRSSRSNSLQQPLNSASKSYNSSSLSKRLSMLNAELTSNAVSTADQSIKNLSSTFGNSYRFLMAKFVDRKEAATAAGGLNPDDKFPSTLADARKVVGLEPFSPSSSDFQHDEVFSRSSRETSSTDLRATANVHTKQRSIGGTGDTMLSKLAGGVIRNLRSPSFGQHSQYSQDSVPSTGEDDVKIQDGPPIERFLNSDTDVLTVADIRELHADYKRLARLLRHPGA
jgi:hypothetical protein